MKKINKFFLIFFVFCFIYIGFILYKYSLPDKVFDFINALIGFLGFISTLILSFIVYSQNNKINKINSEQIEKIHSDANRPFIDVMIKQLDQTVAFSIKNTGNFTAKKVKVKFPNEFIEHVKNSTFNMFANPIIVFSENEYTILPNNGYTFNFAVPGSNFISFYDLSITLEIEYYSHRNEKFTDKIVIEFKKYDFMSIDTTPSGMEKTLSENFKLINDTLEKISSKI